MITIEQELQDATLKDSRAPTFSAIVEDTKMDYTEISGLNQDPYAVRKVVRSSEGYYACIGYKRGEQANGGKIYYRKMTGVTQASDWNAAWTTSFGPTSVNSGFRADRADVVTDGDDVYVAYYWQYPYTLNVNKIGNVKLRLSESQGDDGTWGDEMDLGGDSWLHPGEYDWVSRGSDAYEYYQVVDVAFADSENLFVVLRHRSANSAKVVHYRRVPGVKKFLWVESKEWDNGEGWHFPEWDWYTTPAPFNSYRDSSVLCGKRVFAFTDSSNQRQLYPDKVLLLNTTILNSDPSDPTTPEFTKNRIYRAKFVYGPSQWLSCGGLFSMYEQALGGSVGEEDHQYHLMGPMTEFDGLYHTGIAEEYKSAADKGGYDTSYAFYLAKTKDGLSYEMLPMDFLFGTDEPNAHYVGSKNHNTIAGIVLAENGTQVAVIMGMNLIQWSYETIFKVYLCDYGPWFGSSGTQADVTDHIVSPISLSRSVRSAATGEIELTNEGDLYTDHSIVDGGSRITIAAGYSGRLQDRFVGTLLNSSDTITVPKTRAFKLFDNLQRASRTKQSRPHIIKGQNVFRLDFEDVLDIDSMVIQTGVWEIQDGKLIQNLTDGKGALILAGYEPDSAYVIETAFEFSDGMSNSSAGIALRVNVVDSESHNSWYDWLTVIYVEADDRLELRWLTDRVGNEITSPTSITYSDPVYMSEGKILELSVHCRGGNVIVFHRWRESVQEKPSDLVYYTMAICSPYEQDGITNIVARGIFDGYVGLYTDITEGEVQFHDFTVYSAFPARTHSDAMRYLARISGMDNGEVYAIDHVFDDFDPATDPPDPPWNLTSRIGAWLLLDSPRRAIAYRWLGGASPPEYWDSDQHLLLACDVSATDIVVKANVEVGGTYYNSPTTYAGVFLRGSSDLSSCYAGYITGNRAFICKKTSGTWSYLTQVPWPFTENLLTVGTTGYEAGIQRRINSINIAFSARGPFLSLFVDDILIAWAYDTDLEDEGSVGMMAFVEDIEGNSGWFRSFTVDGFYKPLDVVALRPGDNAIAAMNQLADMYDGGQFFCDESGQLKWGIFNDTVVDLDTRHIASDVTFSRNLDQILTQVRVVGENAYAEVRQTPWARRLGGHIYSEVSDGSIDMRIAARSRAISELENSKKILENSVELRGHPGLELCDNIGLARSPELDYTVRRILGLNESISGSVYTMSLSQLETNEAQEP
jgi:hypothetical protein